MPLTNDRVKETTTDSGIGTGSYALLGAEFGYDAFASAFAVGSYVQYAIVHQTLDEWEVGYGYLTSASVLARSKPMNGTNGTSLVNFSAGTKDVFATAVATALLAGSGGRSLARARNWAMP